MRISSGRLPSSLGNGRGIGLANETPRDCNASRNLLRPGDGIVPFLWKWDFAKVDRFSIRGWRSGWSYEGCLLRRYFVAIANARRSSIHVLPSALITIVKQFCNYILFFKSVSFFDVDPNQSSKVATGQR